MIQKTQKKMKFMGRNVFPLQKIQHNILKKMSISFFSMIKESLHFISDRKITEKNECCTFEIHFVINVDTY